MAVLSKITALFSSSLPAVAQEIYDNLRAADVPVSDEPCRSCPNPCDQDHDDYSARLSIDMDSDMLGSVKPYRRQVLVSTGNSDWPKDVTEVEGSLAAFLSGISEGNPGDRVENAEKIQTPLPGGLFAQNETRRLAIQNASHDSFSHDPSQETVIVFPDFKVIADVPRSLAGAEKLWTAALDPSCGRMGSKSRTDPFSSPSQKSPLNFPSCKGSHKRRDKRCGVAAPVLEKTFVHYLEHEGWVVHTKLEDLSGIATLESSLLGGPDPETAFETQLKALGEGGHKALILRTSHVGGHKFAGNVIIYHPQGTGVWYGRVTPHDIESIVKNTIINGQVLLPILRGGVNLARPGRQALHDW